MEIKEKLALLQEQLLSMQSVMVAYSGGVDSSLLLKVAYDTLGDRAVAVTAVSEVTATGEAADAEAFAKKIGAKHLIIETEELLDDRFAANPAERCYYCKQELFTKLQSLAVTQQLKHIIYGANADDLGDHRPGMKAAKDMQIRAPLLEAGLTKMEIRLLAKELDLPNWDRPALACLASRFPYGTRITKQNLAMVDQAEFFLRSIGFGQLRVRHHGGIARLELLAEDFAKAVELREAIIVHLKQLGYKYIALDLQGFRSGSMNEVLSDR